MKNFLKLLIFFAITLNAFGGIPEKFPSDDIIFGKGNASFDKSITIDIGDGGSNPKLLIDKTLKVFDFNKGLDVTGAGVFSGNISGVDGTFTGALSSDGNTVTFGDGADSDKKQIWDIGAGGSNPYFGYSAATGALVFNNGVTEKKIGSGAGGGGAGINLLANSSFEDPGSPILNWANTGGTFTQETHTNGRDNNEKFARLIASGSGEYFLSDAVTVSDDNGSGCMADFKYTQGDNAFDYKVLKSPYADPADVVSEGSVSDLTVFLKAPTIVFDCAGGDLFKLKVISTAAGTIDVDEAYLGSNKGFISGTYTNSIKLEGNDGRVITVGTEDIHYSGSGTGWTSTGDTHFYTVQRDGSVIEITTTIEATTNTQRELYIYKNGTIYKMIAVPADVLFNRSGTYISSVGEFLKDDQLSIRFGIAAGTLVNDVVNHYLNINERSGETQEAFTPEQADFLVEANVTGSTTGLGTSTDGAFVNVSNSGATFTNIKGSFSETGTSGGFSITGTFPLSGNYRICAAFPYDVNATTMSEDFRIAVCDGSSECSATGDIYSDTLNRGSAGLNVSVGLEICREIDLSHGLKTVTFQEQTLVASGVTNNNIDISAQTEPFKWSIHLVSHNVSRPIIQNMIDTTRPQGKRVETCTVNQSSGTPLAYTNDCSNWADSFTDVATGEYDINYSNIWSEAPTCVCMDKEISRNCSGRDSATQATTSKAKFKTFTTSTTSGVDSYSTITCWGDR